MEVFGSNTSGENLLKELEKLVQNHLKNLGENSPKTPLFIGLEKLVVGAFFQPWRLMVDRPGRPLTFRFLTVGALVDRTGRPLPGTENRVLCRLTGPVDRGFPESRSSLRSTSPPAVLAYTFCARRSTGSVDRLQARSTGPVDRQKPEQTLKGIKNLVLI